MKTKKTNSSKGIALNIGLNSVDPAHYSGWSGDLLACEADAEDMAQIAKANGFKTTKLLTKTATRSAVAQHLKNAAGTLKAGDILFLTYSGHGGQLPDLNKDEPDAQDETWCLFDGELVDDEISNLLASFAKGVRILVFSDSCHSGTVIKLAYYERSIDRSGSEPGSGKRYRYMPREIASRTYAQNKTFYDSLLKNKKLKTMDQVQASVILISGCQDNQLSADGTFNGLFTANLLSVWNSGKFAGDYKTFHAKIRKQMPPNQTPNFFRAGPTNANFEKQVPFTI